MIKIEKWQIFWKLKVISEWEKRKYPSWQIKRFIKCKCDCWNIWEYSLQKLTLWETKSCWCLLNRKAYNRKELKYKDKIWKWFYFISDIWFIQWKRRINVECKYC